MLELPSHAQAALLLFTLCNAMRIFAYVPQLVRVLRDQNGATAISYWTWSMFALANLSTAFYSGLVLEDTSVTLIFSINAAFCLAIVIATALRRRLRARFVPQPVESTLLGMLTVHKMGD